MKVVYWTMGHVFNQIPYPCDGGVDWRCQISIESNTSSEWPNKNSTNRRSFVENSTNRRSFVESEMSSLNVHRYLLRAAIILQCYWCQCHSFLLCNPWDTDSEKEGFWIKSLASGCSGQFRHSLCHPPLYYILFCSVYKILCSWSTNSCDWESTNSCFIFLLNINLVTIIHLQKSSKHSESFYKHLLSDS